MTAPYSMEGLSEACEVPLPPLGIQGRELMTWEQIREVVRPLGPHWAPTGLIEIENTHNMAGGTVDPPEIADEMCDGAHDAGLPVHLDGARIEAAQSVIVRLDLVLLHRAVHEFDHPGSPGDREFIQPVPAVHHHHVARTETPSSLPITNASVVLPRPGGPTSST